MKIEITYQHVLNKDFNYDYYGPNTARKGTVISTSKTDKKLYSYSLVCGHGVDFKIDPEDINVVLVDDKTGWSNIEEIKDSSSFISIMVEGSKPLPADQEKNFIYSLNFKKLIMKLINHFLTTPTNRINRR